MTRRATLKDVAALAGVSTATVARVLHANGYVAGGTRQSVERALAETGYQINAVAQGLRRQRTFTIGHLIQGTIPNPFFAGVALGVEEEALAQGCGVLLFNTQGDPRREELGVQTLIRRRVDAILFTVALHAASVRLALAAGVPVVQVERMTDVETLGVTVDNHLGAKAATELLLALGHRRIAYVGADPDRLARRPGAATRPNVERERLAGFLDAMREAKVPAAAARIARGRYYAGGGAEGENDGYVWSKRFLAERDRPTAIFATSDILAAGALQAAYERRLRVPDDLSVIGFDDTYAPYFAPPLTTVAQPMVEIGRVAALLALRAIDDRDGAEAERVVRLPTRLEVRGSTGPPPGLATGADLAAAEAVARDRSGKGGPSTW